MFCDECGNWQIKCKFGSIQLFSIVKNQLVFVADFNSSMRKTYFLKKVVKTHAFNFISQEGHIDLCLVFNEVDLHFYDKICRCYHKKKLSPEHRQKLAEQMKKIHAKRKSNGGMIK